MNLQSPLTIVAWICIENGKLLCVKPRKSNVLYLPGGNIEIGESKTEALSREIHEEVGVMLRLDTIQPLFKLDTTSESTVYKPLAVHRYSSSYIGNLVASGEIEDISWSDDSADRKLLSLAVFDVLNEVRKLKLIKKHVMSS